VTVRWSDIKKYAKVFEGHIAGFGALARGDCTKTWHLFLSLEPSLFLGQYGASGLSLSQHEMISRYIELQETKKEA
jgi:hypothetical protein